MWLTFGLKVHKGLGKETSCRARGNWQENPLPWHWESTLQGTWMQADLLRKGWRGREREEEWGKPAGGWWKQGLCFRDVNSSFEWRIQVDIIHGKLKTCSRGEWNYGYRCGRIEDRALRVQEILERNSSLSFFDTFFLKNLFHSWWDVFILEVGADDGNKLRRQWRTQQSRRSSWVV